MKKKFRKIAVLTAVFAVIAGIGGTYAYFSDSVTVTNHISTGDVRIGLEEFEIVDGREQVYTNPKEIMPGDIISKIPRVKNYAEPCWVRARISYESEEKELEGLGDENLKGFSDDWVKRGDYYYLTKILDTSETADVFQTVEVPYQWTEEYSGKKFEIHIRADAIQAAHFKPDFTAMSPWGDEEIEQCVHETDGKVVSTQEQVELSVEFNGEAHKLIAVPDDFFSNFSVVMPGDSLHDSAAIKNTTGQDAEIFFGTGLENPDDQQMDLLEHLQLTVSMNGKQLYSGDLKADDLSKGVSLGIFEPDTEGTLDFTVEVPTELKNVYALREADVKWIFAVYAEGEAEGGSYGEGGNWKQTRSAETVETVKTGDETPIMFWLITCVAGGTILISLVLVKTKGGKRK